MKAVEANLGPVDILINNAGVTRDATLHKMTFDQWDRVMRVDLYGVFNMSRQVIGGMRDRGFGRIISISSLNARKASSGRPTIVSPRQASLVLLRRWRSKAPARA